MTDLKKLADPKSFGPGAWLMIHVLAYHAKTNEEKRTFENAMRTICPGLICETCKVHCGEYLRNHPIRDYWNVKNKAGEDIGMFKWSWAFHNAVNARLGKEIMDYETAYHLYSGEPDTVCTTDCGDESPKAYASHHSHPSYRSSHSHHSNRSRRSPHPRYGRNGLIRFVPTKTALRPYNRR